MFIKEAIEYAQKNDLKSLKRKAWMNSFSVGFDKGLDVLVVQNGTAGKPKFFTPTRDDITHSDWMVTK